jgi:hypothetical protein
LRRDDDGPQQVHEECSLVFTGASPVAAVGNGVHCYKSGHAAASVLGSNKVETTGARC